MGCIVTGRVVGCVRKDAVAATADRRAQEAVGILSLLDVKEARKDDKLRDVKIPLELISVYASQLDDIVAIQVTASPWSDDKGAAAVSYKYVADVTK